MKPRTRRRANASPILRVRWAVYLCVASVRLRPVDFIREVAEAQGWPITFREAA